MTPHVLVVGDSMLDRDVIGRADRLCPEAPVPVLDEATARTAPGGAALAAALLARDGYDVTLLTAFGHDAAGVELGDLLAAAGVVTVNVGYDGETHEKLRLRTRGQLICRVDRGAGAARPVRDGVSRLVDEADAVLVSDYGRGLAAEASIRRTLERAATLVWDPHPRGPAPRRGATLVTPNEEEARRVAGEGDPGALAGRLRELWDAHAVCVTCGERGAVVSHGDAAPLTVGVDAVAGDPSGAGDRFASAVTALLAAGVPLPEAVGAAVEEARGFVAARGWHGAASSAGVDDVAARTRARGGTVVATGGCFDLLHAGHVSMLEAARRLGDCLVVCLNSDASVRRIKGPDRPLVAETDRASVLRALACVDEVVLFDEETPVALLERLQPDVWVKGADYDAAELPEAAVMRRLGGRVVTVPYVAGLSTTELIARAGVGAR